MAASRKLIAQTPSIEKGGAAAACLKCTATRAQGTLLQGHIEPRDHPFGALAVRFQEGHELLGRA